MTSEWPAWHVVRLPRVLLDELRRTGVNRYVGKCIIAHCQRYRTLLLLRLAPRSRVMQLSRRELQVADLYGKGMRAKAVAKALNITPATARNMLQRIYLNKQQRNELTKLFIAAGYTDIQTSSYRRTLSAEGAAAYSRCLAEHSNKLVATFTKWWPNRLPWRRNWRLLPDTYTSYCAVFSRAFYSLSLLRRTKL